MTDGSVNNETPHVEEPGKKVPTAYDVDVVVAGAGVSGVFAAIASARSGAKTVLIDRFGYPGGNMGPGMIAGGSFDGMGGLRDVYVEKSLVTHPFVLRGFAGIPREFVERHAALGGGSIPPFRASQYMRDSGIASHVALTMLEESGVELLLSTYVSDPVMEGKRIRGVFVENKSGRQAVLADVVVDATGEADVARRAEAPILYPKESYNELDTHAPNGIGTLAVVGGVDKTIFKEYQQVAGMVEFEERDLFGLARVSMKLMTFSKDGGDLTNPGVLGLKVQLLRPHAEVDTGNAEHMSRMERGIRGYTFDMVQHLKRKIPGFENAYLLCIAPFLGIRGGPCIKGEYTLTMDDCRAGRRFDDVMYLYGEPRALRHTREKTGQCLWTDMPYRVMVPEEIDGLLAVGRSASGIPDTLLRNRMSVMHMGQACGAAAALAAVSNVTLRKLDIKELQRRLLDTGFYLGNRERLRELRLV